MAPGLSRKRKSDEMDDAPATPTKSPAAKRMKITASQKQALIDNLQLEITERARHLRAHYALQCADLRARIERRINRVPLAMRKMTMGELLAKHEVSTTTKPTGTGAIEAQPISASSRAGRVQEAVAQRQEPVRQPARPRKRKSSDIHIISDKENNEPADESQSTVAASSIAGDTLPVQKNTKRAKTAASSKTKQPQRAPSRNQRQAPKSAATGILSPRSYNSRTLPRSPLKPTNAGTENMSNAPPSPTKSSPAKSTTAAIPRPPASPFKSAATALRRGASKLAQATRPSSRDADSTQAANLSPMGKMLPPPRPAPTHLTTSFGTMLSPQRSASQTSISATSEGSNTSITTSGSGNTVESSATTVVKPKRGTTRIANTTVKAIAKASAAAGRGKKTAATATVLSPRSANTGASRKVASGAKKTPVASAPKKAVGAAAPASTGRVLRKRN